MPVCPCVCERERGPLWELYSVLASCCTGRDIHRKKHIPAFISDSSSSSGVRVGASDVEIEKKGRVDRS